MNFVIQRCCATPEYLEEYDTSVDAVLNKLGVGVVNIKEFNCCGYPFRNINFKAYILSSVRNLSLAEKRGMDIMTLCGCCYGNLKYANHLMNKDKSMKDEINRTLDKEDLSYHGDVKIRHIMEILYKDVGIEGIRKKIVRSFDGLKVAVHYGCHILRPRQLVQFDTLGTSSIFNSLVEITGAEIISWPSQLECCGSPLLGIDDELSMDLTHNKIISAREGGADFICVACPYCQLQFDRVQQMFFESRGLNNHMPSILYTQLLGLSLGVDEVKLGIHNIKLGINGTKNFFSKALFYFKEDRHEKKEQDFGKSIFTQRYRS